MGLITSPSNGQPIGQAAGASKHVTPAEGLAKLDGKLLDLLPGAVYFCDHEGVLIGWNRRAVELWGREPKAGDRSERFCGSYKLYRLDGTFMAHADCPVADTLRTGQPQANIEAIIERPDGSRRFILANIDALRDESGAVVGAVNILQDISERKQAEAALRQSEQRFRRLLDNLPAAGYTCDAQGHITYFNRRAVELWGREPKLNDPVDRYCGSFKLFSTDGSPIVHDKCWMALALRHQRDYNGRAIVVERPDGSRRTALAHASPFHESDNLIGAVNVLVDVTDRRQVEEKLRESEERFRATLDQAAVGVAHVGLDHRTLWANPGLCAMLGYTESEMRERTFLDLTHPDDLDADLGLGRRLLAGDIPSYRIEKRYYHKNGSVVWGDLAVSLVRDAAGGTRYIVGVVVDVTERKRAEARLEAVLASINDHLVCYDCQWRYTFVNDKAAQVLGRSKEDLLGKSIWELFPGAVGNQYYQELHTSLAEQRVIRSEHYYAPFETWFENHIYPSPDGVTVFSADVTWRKRLEDELRRHNERLAEADRRKDEFLATLAHELRNPLAPIRNALQILNMPMVDAETARRSREMMERQVHHLVRLVDDLLDVSRVMRGKIELRREQTELASVVARAVETVQPLVDAQGHQLSVRLPSESLPVEVDPVRLAQVVGNLLTNAAKYTETGGRIWLTAQRFGDTVELRVRDTGIGIGMDMLPRIFELFVQVDHSSTKAQGGLGIGLTLVKNLVEMHGGTVEARSEGLGRGSEFVVRLPTSAQPLQKNGVESEQRVDAVAASGHRLLVVDDNQDAAISLAMLLKLQGHEVRVAHSGMAALELTKTYVPHAVFLDIGMPGMDGYEVARQMRQQPGLEKVVLAALTGWGQQEDRRRTAEAGFDHHLVKPPEPNALGGILASLSERR